MYRIISSNWELCFPIIAIIAGIYVLFSGSLDTRPTASFSNSDGRCVSFTDLDGEHPCPENLQSLEYHMRWVD